MSNEVRFYLTKCFSNDIKIPLAMRTIQKYVKEVAERARIHKIVSPHVLRHTFAVTYLHRGGNLRALQAILGHSSITTTDIYLNYSGARVIEDFERTWYNKSEKYGNPFE
jgi:integrase/recombinase XerD